MVVTLACYDVMQCPKEVRGRCPVYQRDCPMETVLERLTAPAPHRLERAELGRFLEGSAPTAAELWAQRLLSSERPLKLANFLRENRDLALDHLTALLTAVGRQLQGEELGEEQRQRLESNLWRWACLVDPDCVYCLDLGRQSLWELLWTYRERGAVLFRNGDLSEVADSVFAAGEALHGLVVDLVQQWIVPYDDSD